MIEQLGVELDPRGNVASGRELHDVGARRLRGRRHAPRPVAGGLGDRRRPQGGGGDRSVFAGVTWGVISPGSRLALRRRRLLEPFSHRTIVLTEVLPSHDAIGFDDKVPTDQWLFFPLAAGKRLYWRDRWNWKSTARSLGQTRGRWRAQWFGRVFSHEQSSSWESVVTNVRSKAKAVAARKMSPRSDWGSSILEASLATAKVNGASRSGTWAITSSSHCEKPCRTRRRFRLTEADALPKSTPAIDTVRCRLDGVRAGLFGRVSQGYEVPRSRCGYRGATSFSNCPATECSDRFGDVTGDLNGVFCTPQPGRHLFRTSRHHLGYRTSESCDPYRCASAPHVLQDGQTRCLELGNRDLPHIQLVP